MTSLGHLGLRAWLAQHWHARAVRRWLIAVVVVGTVLPVSQARANVDLVDVEDEVMCVVCERPLSTSAGSAAEDQRAVIQRMIDDGLSKDEIKDELVAEYGERVLVDDGNPVAAAAPVIVAVIGAGSIALLLRRRRRDESAGTNATPQAQVTDDPRTAAAPTDTSSPQVSAADDARIDAELAERE